VRPRLLALALVVPSAYGASAVDKLKTLPADKCHHDALIDAGLANYADRTLQRAHYLQMRRR
jgi:hypothetical protein